jgi:hypothetical protein
MERNQGDRRRDRRGAKLERATVAKLLAEPAREREDEIRLVLEEMQEVLAREAQLAVAPSTDRGRARRSTEQSELAEGVVAPEHAQDGRPGRLLTTSRPPERTTYRLSPSSPARDSHVPADSGTSVAWPPSCARMSSVRAAKTATWPSASPLSDLVSEGIGSNNRERRTLARR